MLKRKSDDIDLNVALDEQPHVKPLREAAEAAQRRWDGLCAEWVAAKRIQNPETGVHVTTTERLRARATERDLLPKLEAAEIDLIAARDQFERARKETAVKLRELREPERLRLLEDVGQALHHAAACLVELGQWCSGTADVTGQPGDAWGFARELTVESIEQWLGYKRAAR